MSSPLLIVGASVRAAAASALRAGFAPWCVDLFADADLARACPTRTVPLEQYGRRMIEALADGPPGPWMYTGGLENHPEILDLPLRERWGNGPEIIRAVRNPFHLADRLLEAGFDVPRLHGERGASAPRGRSDGVASLAPGADVVPRGADTPRSPWLLKPYRGSGGLEVRAWNGESVDVKREYLQEYIDGTPASAVFAGTDQKSIFFGATRQLISPPWSHAPMPFQYAGSIGPLDASPAVIDDLIRLGDVLVQTFGLQGLFGIDFLLDGERVRPLEVNPRYPASLEILERDAGEPLFTWHAASFVGQASSLSVPIPAMASSSRAGQTSWKLTPRKCGKAILFAAADIVIPAHGPWESAFDFELSDLEVSFADVPTAGQFIPRGAPVLTFFAEGETAAACETALAKIAGDLDRVLFQR